MSKILFLFLLVSMPICSQTVPKDTLQFIGSFSLSGSLTSGTEFQRTFQFEFNPTFEKRSWSFENQFRFLFSDADGEVLNRNWDALSLFKLYINGQKRWHPFLVTDLQTNLGYELEFRLGYGGCITYKPTLKNSMLRLVLHYDGGTQIFKDKLLLKSNGWFLRSTRESADYIFKLYVSLELKLTQVFSLTTDYRFNYENVSLESLDSNQQFTSIGVKADFK